MKKWLATGSWVLVTLILIYIVGERELPSWLVAGGAVLWTLFGISLWWSDDHSEWLGTRKNFPNILNGLLSLAVVALLGGAAYNVGKPALEALRETWTAIEPNLGLSGQLCLSAVVVIILIAIVRFISHNAH